MCHENRLVAWAVCYIQKDQERESKKRNRTKEKADGTEQIEKGGEGGGQEEREDGNATDSGAAAGTRGQQRGAQNQRAAPRRKPTPPTDAFHLVSHQLTSDTGTLNMPQPRAGKPAGISSPNSTTHPSSIQEEERGR